MVFSTTRPAADHLAALLVPPSRSDLDVATGGIVNAQLRFTLNGEDAVGIGRRVKPLHVLRMDRGGRYPVRFDLEGSEI